MQNLASTSGNGEGGSEQIREGALVSQKPTTDAVERFLSMLRFDSRGKVNALTIRRARSEKTNERSYRTSCKVEFGITSLKRQEASPAHLLSLRRAHWGIEMGLHDHHA